MLKTHDTGAAKLRQIAELFAVFFKIGAFTFGGGYAMIALLENELVTKRQWLSREEFLDMAAISESTPGPVAINSATYLGYKRAGVAGSAAATVAVSLPSFLIIYIISLFFEQFLSLTLVSAAFKGVGAGVIYLIFSAGLRMLQSLEKSRFDWCIFGLVGGAMVLCSLLGISISSVLCIVLSGAAGVAAYLVRRGKGGDGHAA